MSNVPQFDVVVVGGGPAGSATALSLFRHSQKLTCLLIDDTQPKVFKIGESLPPEAFRLLQYLNPAVLNIMKDQISMGIHTLCTGNASAWTTPDVEERHAILNPFGHGLHLNRAVFDETMRNSVLDLSKKSTAISFVNGRLTDLQASGAFWTIQVKTGDEIKIIRARWLVDATGRRASLATKLGANIITPNPLLAFFALFIGPELTDPAEGDNDKRTLIEATPDGWFYSSLLSRNPCSRIVAFHTLPTHPAAKQSRRRDGFLDILEATAPLTAKIIRDNDYTIMKDGGYPRCTAAGSSYLDRLCDPSKRWIAVGDAAVAFDPLSSQGIMTALEMGYFIGLKIAKLLEEDCEEPGFEDEVESMFLNVKEDYDKHRKYYYGVVERFKEGDFWKCVCS